MYLLFVCLTLEVKLLVIQFIKGESEAEATKYFALLYSENWF